MLPHRQEWEEKRKLADIAELPAPSRHAPSDRVDRSALKRTEQAARALNVRAEIL